MSSVHSVLQNIDAIEVIVHSCYVPYVQAIYICDVRISTVFEEQVQGTGIAPTGSDVGCCPSLISGARWRIQIYCFMLQDELENFVPFVGVDSSRDVQNIQIYSICKNEGLIDAEFLNVIVNAAGMSSENVKHLKHKYPDK